MIIRIIKPRAQMEISTLAKLVIILVVMAVVLLFFTGGFKQIGTQKFVAAANNSTTATGTGISDTISNLIGSF